MGTPAQSGHLESLDGIDWEDVGIRLTAYSTWKAANLRWRTGRAGDLAAGKTPEDVAEDAIWKVFEGRRRWDPQRGPLLPYLRRVVDSLMNELAESADNRRQQRLDEDGLPHRAAADGDPGAAERVERLRAVLAREDKPDLLAIVDAVVQSCEPTPQAIAGQLGTTVLDVNNRLKRLRRFAHKLMGPTRQPRGAARQ